jgi:hypothetical protein
MVRIKKFIVGIKPATKMFRIGTLGGSVIDAVLAARAEKALSEAYFSEVGRASDRVGYLLSNDELGNTLRIEDSNIIFIKDLYDSERKFDLAEILAEWRFLWKVVNGILEVRDVHRIGVAAEHQFESVGGTASNKLHSAFFAGAHPQHAGRFNLQYEERRPAMGKTGLPDIKKDAFVNVLHHYYDSELDDDHDVKGRINANLDVQKYYSPYFNGSTLGTATSRSSLDRRRHCRISCTLECFAA